jgi:hypothetical protein
MQIRHYSFSVGIVTLSAMILIVIVHNGLGHRVRAGTTAVSTAAIGSCSCSSGPGPSGRTSGRIILTFSVRRLILVVRRSVSSTIGNYDILSGGANKELSGGGEDDAGGGEEDSGGGSTLSKA